MILVEIISISCAFGLIYKLSRTNIRKFLMLRKFGIIKNRLTLQKQLKDARKVYEEANITYLHSIEKRARWIDDADAILQHKIDTLRKEHDNTIKAMHQQFNMQQHTIDIQNQKNYVQDLVAALGRQLKQETESANFTNIIKLNKQDK